MALAIELAAARLPSLGLDGLEAGLADRLRLLTGGPADRRPASFAALDPRLELRAAGRTRSGGAAPGLGVRRPVHRCRGGGGARRLAAGDWRRHPGHPGRARRPEPAGRDRGSERRLATAPWRPSASTAPSGSRTLASRTRRASRHLSWCLAGRRGSRPVAPAGPTVPWRAAFDQVADELRGALAWAAGNARYRAEAYRLAICLAELSFARGMPGESQRRYEQAAELAADDRRRRGRLCAAPQAPRSPGISATRRCGCAGRRPTRRSARVTGPARRWTSPGRLS